MLWKGLPERLYDYFDNLFYGRSSNVYTFHNFFVFFFVKNSLIHVSAHKEHGHKINLGKNFGQRAIGTHGSGTQSHGIYDLAIFSKRICA